MKLSKLFLFSLFFSLLLIVSIVNAEVIIEQPEAGSDTINVFTGINLTNLSELADTNIDDGATSDDEVLTWDTGTRRWIAQSAQAVGDTNETVRVGNAINSPCSGTDKLSSILSNGTLNCTADVSAGAIENNTAGWTLNITKLYPTTFFTLLSSFRWNMFDDGTDMFLNVTNGGGDFAIEQENTKITLFNNPVAGNDWKAFQVFSKTAGFDSEFVITKALATLGDFHGRSLMVGGAEANCSAMTRLVGCDTDVTGADLLVQDEIWNGGAAFFSNGSVNITDSGNIIAEGNITAHGNFILNATTAFTLQDLNRTIGDTNASSCADGEYLDGTGGCVNFNLTVIRISLNNSDANLIYLNLSGTNANQNMNVSNFNITAGSYFGDGQNLDLAQVSGSSFSTIQELQNLFHSSGVFNENSSVNFILKNGDISFNVTSGRGTIRATNNATDVLFFFDWSASDDIAIALNEVIFVGVEWNAGSPQVVTKSTNIWDTQMEFPLGSLIRDVSGLHLQREDHAVGDHANNMIVRLFDTLPLARANRDGGLIIGTSGRNITVTSGTLWEKLNKFDISAIDTAASDTFDRYYRNGSGGWFAQEDATQWNNTHFDDGTGTLSALANNRWSIEWVYLEVDQEIVTLFGQEEFLSEGAAEGASPPSTAPDRIQQHSRLIGRIIFQESAETAAATESVFTTTFTSAGVTDHGNLAGLSDDDHTQYILADGTRQLTGNWDADSNATFTNITTTDNVNGANQTMFQELINDFLNWLTASEIEGLFNSSSWNKSGSNVFLADSGDNVGIGIINPSEKLNVSGNIGVTQNVTASFYFGNGSGLTGIGDASYQFGSNNFNGSGNFTTSGDINLGNTNGKLILYDSGTNEFITTADGNSGHIGIIARQRILMHIDSDNDSIDQYFAVNKDNVTIGGGIELFRVQEDGKVGIGTTAPTHTLNVVGDVNVTGEINEVNQSIFDRLISNAFFWILPSDFQSFFNDNLTAALPLTNQTISNAANITAGTFGAGNYVISTNLTIERLVFENDVGHTMTDNSTCISMRGDTSTFEVC